ncbi:unnamed protein product [Caenorhabditis angaria]|uniref:Uncharacterized protein n=1 Tax=Caenorhabditis angaria TaxID=860376 RepID=A0A9P1II65_9PELO|nr:unnamed protein product [Caenorhabditis angaria]
MDTLKIENLLEIAQEIIKNTILDIEKAGKRSDLKALIDDVKINLNIVYDDLLKPIKDNISKTLKIRLAVAPNKKQWLTPKKPREHVNLPRRVRGRKNTLLKSISMGILHRRG